MCEKAMKNRVFEAAEGFLVRLVGFGGFVLVHEGHQGHE